MSPSRVILLYGGTSSEHEISIRSARSLLAAIDRNAYEPIPVAIRRDRIWNTGTPDRDLAEIVHGGRTVTDLRALQPDLVFPVLHGPYGEDGTIQGYLETLGIPYVGSGVLASAVCMDKIVQRRLIASAAPEVPMARWREVDGTEVADDARCSRIADELARALGLPCFVKPANLGSSVGVAKATSVQALVQGLQTAAIYDQRIVVEEGIDAREIELAILERAGERSGERPGDLLVSQPGEICLPPGQWYDYDNKYLNDVATLAIPADLPSDAVATLQRLATRSFRATGCSGLARVDFLVDRRTGQPYLNELNTMPGFTSISMYPKLIEHSGISYTELVTRLCELAVSRHRRRAALKIDR